MENTYLPIDFLPIVVQFGLAIAFIGLSTLASHFLGPRRNSKAKNDPFECGIEVVGDARTPISIKYFLVAILFVLFDVEVIFMYPWAANFERLGTEGFLAALLFLALLMAGFYYDLRKGVLDWEK